MQLNRPPRMFNVLADVVVGIYELRDMQARYSIYQKTMRARLAIVPFLDRFAGSQSIHCTRENISNGAQYQKPNQFQVYIYIALFPVCVCIVCTAALSFDIH